MIVEVFGKPSCVYCNYAKTLLEERQQEYAYIDIVANESSLKELFQRVPDAKTVPQIFIDGEHVGGFDDLREWYKIKDTETTKT